jgi:hypothetical protein
MRLRTIRARARERLDANVRVIAIPPSVQSAFPFWSRRRAMIGARAPPAAQTMIRCAVAVRNGDRRRLTQLLQRLGPSLGVGRDQYPTSLPGHNG